MSLRRKDTALRPRLLAAGPASLDSLLRNVGKNAAAEKTAKWPLSTLTDTATPLSAVGATLSAPRVLAVDDAATSGTPPGRCSSGAATPLSQGRLGERQADGLTLRLARRLHRISRRTAPMRHRRSFASRR